MPDRPWAPTFRGFSLLAPQSPLGLDFPPCRSPILRLPQLRGFQLSNQVRSPTAALFTPLMGRSSLGRSSPLRGWLSASSNTSAGLLSWAFIVTSSIAALCTCALQSFIEPKDCPLPGFLRGVFRLGNPTRHCWLVEPSTPRGRDQRRHRGLLCTTSTPRRKAIFRRVSPRSPRARQGHGFAELSTGSPQRAPAPLSRSETSPKRVRSSRNQSAIRR